jgi:uncharacterized protein (DUF305 family)
MDMKQEGHLHSETNMMMYKRLAIMIVLSFAAMYIFMYAMVDRLSNVVPNINQFYMAGLMTMPMLIIELLVMRNMYRKKKLNILLLTLGFLGAIVFFLCIHNQVGITDKQFLKSMIPHHAAAVLMVEKTELKDQEIKELANNIITSQQAEIEFMKKKLKELEK